MRFNSAALIMTGALTLIPLSSFAVQATAPAAKAKASATAKAPTTHATTGVVKSVDATSLVITKGNSKTSTMTFDISPATTKDGSVEVGSSVSKVRRLEDEVQVGTTSHWRRGELAFPSAPCLVPTILSPCSPRPDNCSYQISIF
jgi:hypothetical protein